jgi:uncharacterized membrane protein YesL
VDTLFSADSVLMRGLTRLADVMILNVLFVVTSLPVVTLGASLTALNFTAMRIGTGECNAVTADYMRSFRKNFRQATGLALALAAFAAVLAAWYIVLPTLALGAVAELALLAIWYILAFSLAITALFAFPYLASFEGRIRDVLHNALLLSWRHLLTALIGLAIILLSLGVTMFYPQAIGYGLVWLLVGFAGIALATGFLFTRIFSKYTAAPTSGAA